VGGKAIGICGGEAGNITWDGFTAADIPSVIHRASTAGTGNTTTSVGIVIPASTVANDIVIAAFVNGGSTADATVADDEGAGTWAKILSGDDGTSNLSVWWKRASANTASKTVTASSMTNSCTGVVSVYSGALTSGNPYAGHTFENNISGNESHAAITPTVNGSMVILVVGQQPDIAIDTEAATSPAVLIERGEHLSTGGLDCSVALASEVQVTAGTTGALTWAQTNAATMSIAFYLTPEVAASGLSATVNQITETDLAQAISRLKVKAIGQNTETDLSQTVTRVKSKAIGQNSETDLAQAIAWVPKHRLVNQVIESDLSQAIARLKAKAIGQPLETDFAQEVTRDTSVIVAVAQATETDLSQAIARLKTKAVNQVLETDLAQILVGVKTRAIAQISETNLAQALTHSKLKAVGQITETDLAQAVARLKTAGIAQIVEADLAQIITHLKTKVLGQAAETDLAQVVTATGLKLINVEQVSETDLAQAILWNPKIRIVAQIAETNLAQIIARVKAKTLGQVSETDLAQVIQGFNVHIVNQASETDLAQVITSLKLRLLGIVTETDLAQAVTGNKASAVSMVSESSLAQALTAVKAREIAQALESDFAQAVAWSPKSRIVAQVFETDLAQIILYAPSQTVGNVWRFEAVIIGASKLDTATIAGASFTGAAVATSKLTDAEFKE
jgi:CBS domain-containing protein